MARAAIIIANGTYPREAIVRREIRNASFVLAADGGANYLNALGIAPDVILGDLDSLATPVSAQSTLIRAPDQDRTDLDKAADYLIQAGFDSITILGVTGDRLDHTFSALAVVAKYGVRLVDDVGVAIAVRGPGSVSMEAVSGSIVSILPCGAVSGVTTTNLKWVLNGAQFDFAVRDGTSNVAVGESITVSVEQGIAIVYVHHPRGMYD